MWWQGPGFICLQAQNELAVTSVFRPLPVSIVSMNDTQLPKPETSSPISQFLNTSQTYSHLKPHCHFAKSLSIHWLQPYRPLQLQSCSPSVYSDLLKSPHPQTFQEHPEALGMTSQLCNSATSAVLATHPRQTSCFMTQPQLISFPGTATSLVSFLLVTHAFF